jgi:tetratricopeptide (TPR) repeat protein
MTLKVFISSTSEDLKPYRRAAYKALHKLKLQPIGMEDFPPSPHDAVRVCQDMVEDCDIYLGIYAHRYGWQPFGEASITQMEYEWAMAKGLPVYIFIVEPNHPWPPMHVDEGDLKARLTNFKDSVKSKHVVKFFKAQVRFKEDLMAALKDVSDSLPPKPISLDAPLSPLGETPTKPLPYTAHEYSLLGDRGLVGRQAELGLLTDWISRPGSPAYGAQLLHFVAIGGMGKSALTWDWYKHRAGGLKAWAGRMWWSFYESDANFENFILRALSYVESRPAEELRKLYNRAEQEARLLAALRRDPYLIVLDGLERILNAYARMDAAHLADDDLDVQTAHHVAGAWGLPESAAESFTGQPRLRAATDPRAGQFLRQLCAEMPSRILVSTRLYPVDLQQITGQPLPGNFAVFLRGLSDKDALALWEASGAHGRPETLLPLLRSFENYPLLIRALAGEVNRFKKAPGDFDAWRAKNPDFNPARLTFAEERKKDVMYYCLRDLSADSARVLEAAAAFRGPATYDALEALGQYLGLAESALDAALEDLEDRGLLGWDRRANRYDLHPITRGVAWSKIGQEQKQGVYAGLEGYFRALPMKKEDEVESLDDLTPAIELYHALLGQGRYDEAGRFFYDRLEEATLWRLSAARQRVELLEALFPDGLDQLPRHSDVAAQAFVLNALALAYKASGQPGRALPLYRRNIELRTQQGSQKNVAIGLGNLSDALRQSGALREAESAAAEALANCRARGNPFWEAVSLYQLGLAAAARGAATEAEGHLRASLAIFQEQRHQQMEGVTYAFLAGAALWRGEAAAARLLADQAWDLAGVYRAERNFIRAARLQGAAALALGDLEVADERLHQALTRARAVNYAEEELPALVGLAGLARRRGDLALAHEHLNDIWDMAEAGPYPLHHADALVELARVELAGGDKEKARAAAQAALKMAECDGGEYRYLPGVVAAEGVLKVISGQ